jgi:hypothetical protein
MNGGIRHYPVFSLPLRRSILGLMRLPCQIPLIVILIVTGFRIIHRVTLTLQLFQRHMNQGKIEIIHRELPRIIDTIYMSLPCCFACELFIYDTRQQFLCQA